MLGQVYLTLNTCFFLVNLFQHTIEKMKYSILLFGIMLCSLIQMFAPERVAKIDFVSGSFKNNPNIPFNQPFLIQGELGNDIEFVKINIC